MTVLGLSSSRLTFIWLTEMCRYTHQKMCTGTVTEALFIIGPSKHYVNGFYQQNKLINCDIFPYWNTIAMRMNEIITHNVDQSCK